MRIIFRLIGLAFLAWSLSLLALDLWVWRRGGVLTFEPMGKLWFRLDPGSLNLFEALVERYLWRNLWWNVILPILHQPAVLVLGVIGAILLVLTRPRLRRP
ncbi:MAG TPA: hypothetical protein VHL08_01215 [Dongiaceae bacterium]|jgi:ABC-type Fe3+ transport system permease subunit|nr:hypothetical protein [Dongiaceae bacterium]